MKKNKIKIIVIIIISIILVLALGTIITYQILIHNGKNIDSNTVNVKWPIESIGQFSEGVVAIQSDYKMAYMDVKGNLIVDFLYDDSATFSVFSEGLALVSKNNKYGYIDKQGNVVIDFQYDTGMDFSNGLAGVVKDRKFGYIDKQGNVVVPFVYDDAYPFNEGLAWVCKNELYGCIDEQGNVVVDFQYNFSNMYMDIDNRCHNGLMVVEKNGKYGYIDKNGSVAIPFKYDKAYEFTNDGLALVLYGNKQEYIDTSGKTVISATENYFFDSNFSEGLVAVFSTSTYKEGFMNTRGEIVIDCIYQEVSNFSEGLARVKSDDKYGFIDKNGNMVINCEYDYADDFHEGLAEVENKESNILEHLNSWGVIDTNGMYVLKLKKNSFHTISSIIDTSWNKWVENSKGAEEKYYDINDNYLDNDEITYNSINNNILNTNIDDSITNSVINDNQNFEHISGDVNNDGKVSMLDLSLFKKYYINKTEPSLENNNNYDINGDGNITILDLSKLKTIIVGTDLQ